MLKKKKKRAKKGVQRTKRRARTRRHRAVSARRAFLLRSEPPRAGPNQPSPPPVLPRHRSGPPGPCRPPSARSPPRAAGTRPGTRPIPCPLPVPFFRTAPRRPALPACGGPPAGMPGATRTPRRAAKPPHDRSDQAVSARLFSCAPSRPVPGQPRFVLAVLPSLPAAARYCRTAPFRRPAKPPVHGFPSRRACPRIPRPLYRASFALPALRHTPARLIPPCPAEPTCFVPAAPPSRGRLKAALNRGRTQAYGARRGVGNPDGSPGTTIPPCFTPSLPSDTFLTL